MRRVVRALPLVTFGPSRIAASGPCLLTCMMAEEKETPMADADTLAHDRAPMIQSLAVLVCDEPWSYWGGDMIDTEIRSMVQRLPALRRFWVVLSLAPSWPPGFDRGLRMDHGFMPLELERHSKVWPWFGGEYSAEYSTLLGRISTIAAAEGRGDLEVSLVFDVNLDANYWFGSNWYRRYVKTR